MLAETGGGLEAKTTGIRTFLIADIRGYTYFSQEHGDEAASHLAHAFADIVRGTLPARGAELLELRGDEALCVFDSAREALGTAVKLQRCCREKIDGEAALPLGVGMGLDAGEAVPTEGGYRGRALNMAARLCALARPGEILASQTVATLAGPAEEWSFAHRRPARLKGVEEPVRPVAVIPRPELPPLPALPRRRARLRRRYLAALVAGVVIAGSVAAAALLLTGGSVVTVAPNSVAVIDPTTNRVVSDVPVGPGPGRIAVHRGKVWVLNTANQTISLVDESRRELLRTFGVGATPVDIAVGPDRVWIGDGGSPSILELSADSGAVLRKFVDETLTNAAGTGIAFGFYSLWLLTDKAILVRINPGTGKVIERIRLRGLTFDDVEAGEGGVWVTGCCSNMMRVDPTTDLVEGVQAGAEGSIVAGYKSVWVANTFSRFASQIDPRSYEEVATIPCQETALDVALGAGSVWVACGDGAVLRVDPLTARITQRIQVGGTPAGIAVGAGAVWVSVS